MTMVRWGTIAALGLALSMGRASAAENPKGSGTTTTQKAGTHNTKHLRTVTLTVKSVDTDKHVVTFEVRVEPEANLSESGRPIKLDQLREGDKVKASFDPKTEEVVKVEVTPAE